VSLSFGIVFGLQGFFCRQLTRSQFVRHDGCEPYWAARRNALIAIVVLKSYMDSVGDEGLCFPSSNSTTAATDQKVISPTPFAEGDLEFTCHTVFSLWRTSSGVGGLVPGRNGAVRSTRMDFTLLPTKSPTVVGAPDNGTRHCKRRFQDCSLPLSIPGGQSQPWNRQQWWAG